jgi:hypothetical protein
MDREDGGDCFGLQDKLVCDDDDDIRLEAVAGECALTNDGNCGLPHKGNARLSQFAAQA